MLVVGVNAVHVTPGSGHIRIRGASRINTDVAIGSIFLQTAITLFVERLGALGAIKHLYDY